MKGNGTLRRVVWASSYPPGVEYCEVIRTHDGRALEGGIVRRYKGRGALLGYRIDVDSGWKTRGAIVEQVLGGRRRRVHLEVKNSRWYVNGKEDRRLRGCIDVDLAASPVTNTLPIRRTKMDVGSRIDLVSCWVKFPEMKVAPLRQSYEKIGRSNYQYVSATGFRTRIEVDEFGLVKRYGKYWLAV